MYHMCMPIHYQICNDLTFLNFCNHHKVQQFNKYVRTRVVSLHSLLYIIHKERETQSVFVSHGSVRIHVYSGLMYGSWQYNTV